MMGRTPFEIRAVQLDLARQMETPETICRFIDFAADFGFNAVALYLEGRVRTKSFSCPAPENSYTPAQMSGIVKHAASRQIDVIPIISTLGHAELFLCHEELRPLSESREGKANPLVGGKPSCFCPSVEETYQFLDRYFAEIAEIFPGPYFHIGCDEVWDMGCCSLCAERIRSGETLDDLYAAHVGRMHRIVTGKLRRRMMMWDDIFEELPRALDAIPTDIIQCVWQYDSLVEQSKTHFGSRRRDHRMADYDRRGIPYLIAPWAASGVRNTESLTHYARRFHPTGGLLTLWEGHPLEDQYPAIAFAGRLWSGSQPEDARAICDRAHVDLFGIEDAVFLQALWVVTSLGILSEHQTLESFLRGPVTPYAFERANQARLLELVLGSFRESVRDGFAREVLDGLLLRLRRELAQHEIQEVLEGLYEGWNGSLNLQEKWVERGRGLLTTLARIAADRRNEWQRRRANLGATVDLHTGKLESELHDKLSEFLQAVESGSLQKTGLFVVRYSLPDYFGLPFVRWSVQCAASSEWILIDSGIPKPRGGDHSDCPFFTVKYPIDANLIPIRARIEVTGSGGIGLLHAELRSAGHIFHPKNLGAIAGHVHQPDRLLVDDTAACWIGEPCAPGDLHNFARVVQTHSMEFVFGGTPTAGAGRPATSSQAQEIPTVKGKTP